MGIKNRKGLVCELKAQTKLADDDNTLVFVPLGGIGPVDLVTLNKKTGEFQAYDVKTISTRKQKSYRCKAGDKIYRSPSKQQKQMGVKILYVEYN